MTDNWGLTGHEWAVQMLKQHVVHNSVRHAYLFCGPPGVGRRSLALRLVQALNCPQPLAAGQPCGKCRTCRQIERMQYADLAVIQAEKEGGVLKVESIRTITQSLVLTPYQGRYRVALFSALPGSQRQRRQCPAQDAGGSPAKGHPDPDRGHARTAPADHYIAL